MEVRITEVSFWESDLARSSYAHKALITYRDDISLRQSIPQGKKLAVDKVSLTIAPGTVTCVHGYGLGPQNLIRILALQPSVFGHLSGSITYDDSIRSIGAYCDIAFIAKRKIQSLLHIHVFDYLYYAARLRTTLGTHECRSRAVEAARIVGLDLGTKLQHLKMGQRVQLLIASELVGQPTLICLDDPLSGLDEFSAQEVIDSLTRIARRQYSPTTIVFTVSQPGHCLLRGVNRLIVFANAKVVFNRDISVLSITSTASPHGKTTAPSSPETASNAPRFSDFSRRSPQPTSPLLRPSALGAEDAHGYMEQSSGEDTSNASDVRYIEDQISLGLCSVETRLLAVAGDNVPQNILLLTQREAEQIVRSVCDELSMFIDKCVTRLGGTVENDNDTQEIILSPITKQSSSILTKSTSSSSSSISSRGENHSADKARRQLRQGFGGGFVRAPKKTLDDVAILIWRSKHDLFNNRSRVFLIVVSWVFSAVVLGIIAPSIGDAASADATMSADEGSAVLDSFSLSAAVLCVAGLHILLISLCVPDLCKQLVDISHEINGGYVHQVATWISFLVGDMSMYLALALFNSGIIHFMLDFRGSKGSYFSIICAQSVCFYSAALACAAMSISPYKSVINYLRFCSISILFCGFYERIPELSIVWRTIANVFPSKWIYEALMLCIYDELKMKDVYLGYYGFEDGSIGASITWACVWFALLAFVAVVLISPLTSKISRAPVAANLIRLKSSDYMSPKDVSLHKRTTIADDDGSHASGTRQSSFDPSLISSDIENLRLSVDITTLQMELRQRNTFAAVIAPEYQMTLSFRNVSYMSNDYYQPSSYEDRAGRIAANSASNDPVKPGSNTRPADGGIDSTSHGPPRDVILYDITGKVSPRNLCAIVDGSNEGTERILLRVLSGRADYTGKVSGDIAINGHIIPQGIRVSGVAFVAARDAVTHGCLTVREALTFAALLRRTDQTSCPAVLAWKRRLDSRRGNAVAFSIKDRLPGKSGDLDDRVQEVIDLMGLGEVSEKIIGEYSMAAVGATTAVGGVGVEHGPLHRGITPYQLRCVTIGIELVNKPPLVFIENPFFGLDRYSSKLVSETLRSLAAGGRTVTCSLSSPPPSHMLESFDELMLLGRGMLIYAGSTNKLLSYFDNLGFERRGGQSAVDFILEIVSEQATLRAFGDRKSAMLSLEDLSDLRRTMITDNEPLGIIDDGLTDAATNAGSDSNGEPNKSKRLSTTAMEDAENSVTRHGLIPASNVALGPAARVLARRRWVTAYRTRMLVGRVCARAVILGVFFGSYFFQIDDGNATSRINLFSICYLYSVLFLAEMLPGVHRRQRDFLRERSAGSSASLPYWLSDGAPSNLSCALQSLLFCAPLYPMVGLHWGFERFAYFLLAMFAASLCNLGLVQLCSAMCATLHWARFVDPMYLYISGASFNEFSGNADAQSESGQHITFDDISSRYGFETSRGQAIIRLAFIAVLYRLLWFLVLKLREIANEKRRLRRYMGVARQKARRLVTAGLRWRRMRQRGYTVPGGANNDSARIGSIAGVSLIPVGLRPSSPDDYSIMTTSHGVVPVFSPKSPPAPSAAASTPSLSPTARGSSSVSTSVSVASPRHSTSSPSISIIGGSSSSNMPPRGSEDSQYQFQYKPSTSSSDNGSMRSSSRNSMGSLIFGSVNSSISSMGGNSHHMNYSGGGLGSGFGRDSDVLRQGGVMVDDVTDGSRRPSATSFSLPSGMGTGGFKTNRFSDSLLLPSSVPTSSSDPSSGPTSLTSGRPSRAAGALQQAESEGGDIDDDDLLSPTYDDDVYLT